MVLAAPSPRSHRAPRRGAGPVVVATRGRGGAELRAAQLLADRLGAPVVVVAVLEPIPVYPMTAEALPLPASVEDERQAELVAAVQRELHETIGPAPDWTIEIVRGEPASALVQAARRLDAQLLVLGIGRHRPLDRLLAGETTLRVIRRASCPVLAVPATFDGMPRTAVAAVDFSPSSVHAAACALQLLDGGATLHLAHAWRRSLTASAAVAERELDMSSRLPRLLEQVQAELPVTGGGVQPVPVVLEGDPVPELLAYATAVGADLLVAGRSGRNALERLAAGSVTTGLLRGATCAVLVTPEPGLAVIDRVQRALTGRTEGHTREMWTVQLDGFTERNAGRRTVLEVDDARTGAQAQEIGYALLGATYDHRGGCVELMLGDPSGGTVHLTRTIRHVASVTELVDEAGRSLVLRIQHAGGQTVVSFL